MSVSESMNYGSAANGVEGIELLCEEAVSSLHSGNAAQALDLLTQAFRLSYAGNYISIIGRVLIEMGHAYLSLNEHDRAADCFSTAIKKDTTQSVEMALAAHIGLGRAYQHSGSWSESIESFTAAAKLAKQCDQRAAEASLLNDIADIQLNMGRAKEALATYTRALEAARSAQCYEAEAAGHLGAAAASSQLQNTESIARHCDQALLAMRRVHSRLTIRGMRDKVVEMLKVLGESQQMIALEVALIDAYSANQMNAAMNTHIEMAKLLAERGESDKGLANLETARGFAQALFDRQAEARVVSALADIYEASGLSYMALSVFEEWARMARDAGDRDTELNALESLAAAHERVGNLENAVEILQRATLLAQSKCDRQLEAAYLFEQALVHLKMRNSSIATEALERAKRVLPENLDPALASDIRSKLEELKPKHSGGWGDRVVRK